MKKYTYVPGSFIAAWLIWELIVCLGGFNEALLPTPYKVLVGFGELIGDGVLFKDIADSLVRFFHWLHHFRCGRRILRPYLGVVQGNLELHQSNRSSHSTNFSSSMVAVYRSLFRYRSSAGYCYHLYRSVLPSAVVYSVCYQNIDPVYIKVARNFGIKQPELLFKIVLPAVFPGIASGLHIALGTAWIFLVTGEMVGSQTGLGFLIIDMRNNLRNDLLMVAILTIGFVGLLLDWGVSLIEKWIYKRWGIEK